MAEKKKKSLSAFEKAFAAARKKAGGPDGIFTFKVGGKDKKFTTAYDGEKISKKAKEEYEEMIKGITPIQKIETSEGGVGSKFCSNDTCEI